MRILLDSHLPTALAQQLRRQDVDAVALPEWMGGDYRTGQDDLVLAVARSDRRVLVTYDCRSIPPLLKELAETGQHHGGVVLVDEKTLRHSDTGGLLRALCELARQSGDEDWEDRGGFLCVAGR